MREINTIQAARHGLYHCTQLRQSSHNAAGN